MRVFIGSDHGGFALKEQLIGWLTEAGRGQRDFGVDEVADLGPAELNPDDDYPLIAAKVARAVQAETAAIGILLCRSGQGVSMVANKFSGIRAALAWNIETALASRTDDDANILCLPADYLTEEEAIEVVSQWLAAAFAPDARYQRRLKEIEEIEAERKL